MHHRDIIMRKIIFFILIIIFQINSIYGQSISDFNRLKKQYEEYLDNQQNSMIKDNADLFYYDYPEKEIIDIKNAENVKGDVMEFFGYDFFLSRDSLLAWNNLPIHRLTY